MTPLRFRECIIQASPEVDHVTNRYCTTVRVSGSGRRFRIHTLDLIRFRFIAVEIKAIKGFSENDRVGVEKVTVRRIGRRYLYIYIYM